ncbi:MAG: zinc ribbon domain-containing protein [Polyangia bacterium]|jgi:putative FmdB family regulatory protein|nr:zinc ribbon domain-containing protein [Polyangia bacterium]
MPTYVYECPTCGEFEEQQPMSAPPLQSCPGCGDAVRRIIAPGTSFIVKGQGAAAKHCERDTPCCGRESRCDRPPCGK